MSNGTKNVKGDRKVVVAKYESQSIFKLPDGLDLLDTDVVKGWYVKYNVLHIYHTNGEEVEITPHHDKDDYCHKTPSETEIDDACYGAYEDDDEDDDEKDKQEEQEEEKKSD